MGGYGYMDRGLLSLMAMEWGILAQGAIMDKGILAYRYYGYRK